jgi:molybdopterin-binding protein
VDDVWALASKVIVMFDGKALQSSPPREVFSRPLPGQVVNFLGACNVFPATVEPFQEGELTPLLIGKRKASLLSADKASPRESVIVSIRPESITLAPHRLNISARNQVPGEIVKTERRGPMVWIHAKTGMGNLKAVLTESALEAMELVPGNEAFFIFKASCLKILSRKDQARQLIK